MTADEKNRLMDAARATMNTAIGLVIAEVFSGLAQAPALLLTAAGMIRATGDEDHAGQAAARAAECPAILAIPWPFIYAGSTAWISAVASLRDSLPQFIDLEPAILEKRRERGAREREARATQAKARWETLTAAQRSVLEQAGVTQELLRPLG